jgi:hypothetical protein
MPESREDRYWDTRCRYCEAPLRADGGCCMWYGEPHDLPYQERASTLS